MITAIIFSKNRACQLELLLRSIKLNANNLFSDIIVLYDCDSRGFQLGYEQVSFIYENVRFFKQHDFCEDTKELISKSREYVCFFVDDNFFYRKSPINHRHIESLFYSSDSFGCFSLRLGDNVVVFNQYAKSNNRHVLNHHRKLVYMYEVPINVWQWNTLPKHGYPFGYGFSVDGHIYNTEVLLKAIDFEFDNPNGFEGNFNVNHIPPLMGCLPQNLIVNNPINLVGSSNNAAGKWYGKSLEELNSQFLRGKSIDLGSLCKNEIVGCHQEMEINLI